MKDSIFKSLRGEVIKDAPLGKESWFGCGGTADLLFRPADLDDLSAFLKYWPLKEPFTIIGGLANTIIRDGGIRGVTVQLGKAFSQIQIFPNSSLHGSSVQSMDHTDPSTQGPCDDEKGYIQASCGANNANIAASAVKAGIGGLEFLSGIPGSLGGALCMNAGAYGAEMKDILVGVNALDRSGQSLRLTTEDLKMSYRHTEISEDFIFISAILKGTLEDYEIVKARMNDIKQKRNDTQPIKEFTGGSTFANPSTEELRRAGLPEETKAWQVVELVGGRGFSIGGAQMSQKHCNFMLNTGGATAQDLEMLGEEMRTRALDQFGLDLHWEIKRIGEVRSKE
jgi:UDP-N-acetylmuramate dehydrogenase